MQKTSSALLNGGGNMNPCSQLLVFLVRQKLGIIGFQIEIEIIFSLVDIYTNLKRYHL
jgi:hypothetical protein